jgi:hypothetical protein
MTTKELNVVLGVLLKVGPPINPFRDEALAYVRKDLAIRDQQSKDMHAMNRGDGEWPYYA